MSEWPRIRNYKVHQKGTTKTDSGDVEWRIYIRTNVVTSYMEDSSLFRGVCPELDIDLKGENPFKLIEELAEMIKQQMSVEWTPYLIVSVQSDEELHPKCERGTVFRPNDTDHSFGFRIKISEVQLAEHNGKKRYRQRADYSYRSTSRWNVYDGWPTEGLDDSRYDYTMSALVIDTPENRQAIDIIRVGMRAMVRKLEAVLSPDSIEDALRSALTGNGLPALPTPKRTHKKRRKKKR